MKAYKGFNRDLTCRGFKYEQGKTYETDKAELCKCGFHACEQPLDVFKYYPPASSVYHKVELDDVCGERKENDDSRVCAKKITIGAKLSISDLVAAQVQYVREHCKTQSDDARAATAGYNGVATAGDRGVATAGDRGAATAGDYGAATAGDFGAATAGEHGAATTGNLGVVTSRGRSAVGTNGIAVARGMNTRAKGGMGAVLVLAEEDECSFKLAAWKAAVVDGDKIKPDTWYKLNDGEFVEADEQHES